jgi:hypothetical protein
MNLENQTNPAFGSPKTSFVLGDLGHPKTFLQKVDFSSVTNENLNEN